MSDDTPFLRKIMDHPHEVGPRLVFADWLEERGDPWGELIRLQCELATGDMAADYEDAYARHRKGDLCLFAGPTTRVIERCGRLLDALAPKIIQRMFDSALPGGITMVNQWRAVGGDLIWWRESVWDGNNKTRLFFWRGMPERAAMIDIQWCNWHTWYMGSFPLHSLTIHITSRHNSGQLPETLLDSIAIYAGRLTILEIPYWMPAFTFMPWIENHLNALGEKCHAVTGQPFTLRIGQAMIGGPAHSAAERWQAYCDRWLRDSNVRIVSRLEARPIG